MARKYGDDRARIAAKVAAQDRFVQQSNLDRVSSRIRGAILSFFAGRVHGSEFHADELRKHVAGHCGPVAPDSARRIASEMKRDGKINFECVNRAQSLFRVM